MASKQRPLWGKGKDRIAKPSVLVEYKWTIICVSEENATEVTALK